MEESTPLSFIALTTSLPIRSEIRKPTTIIRITAIITAATDCDKIFESPAPKVFVNEHSDSSIKLVAQVWCSSRNYWEVFFYMQEHVKLEFDKAGVTIPFNQVDVHFDTPDKPVM
ncbi:MAG: mechanosensitive ion channel [Clostridia bacterium]|nr:mechanosensitive ion channel [Clostridia bacterium]